MPSAFNIILFAVMLGVVFVLLRGLLNMIRGGSPERSNRFMQWRVFLQFIALVMIVIAMLYGQSGR